MLASVTTFPLLGFSPRLSSPDFSYYFFLRALDDSAIFLSNTFPPPLFSRAYDTLGTKVLHTGTFGRYEGTRYLGTLVPSYLRRYVPVYDRQPTKLDAVLILQDELLLYFAFFPSSLRLH